MSVPAGCRDEGGVQSRVGRDAAVITLFMPGAELRRSQAEAQAESLWHGACCCYHGYSLFSPVTRACPCVFVCKLPLFALCVQKFTSNLNTKQHRQQQRSTFSMIRFCWSGFKGQVLIKHHVCSASWCVSGLKGLRTHTKGFSMQRGSSAEHIVTEHSLGIARLQTRWSRSATSCACCVLPAAAWVPARCCGCLPQSEDLHVRLTGSCHLDHRETVVHFLRLL